MAHETKAPKDETTECEGWITVYPAYLDKNQTWKQGRKVALKHAAANPNVRDIARICDELKLRYKVELHKAYPRSVEAAAAVLEIKFAAKTKTKLGRDISTAAGGRIKVDLRKGGGMTRLQFLRHVGSHLALLPKQPAKKKKKKRQT